MWNLLKNEEECRKLRDLLEDAAAARPDAVNINGLSEVLSPVAQTHIAACATCQEAAQDLLAAREIFRGFAPSTATQRPWFAARVMGAIAAREGELSGSASAWLAVPKFASRLAMASGTLLLVASTWLYERPQPAANQQAANLAAQESLFETSPPANQDDVFVIGQENNR
jgi:hypothetical protein